MNRIMSFLTNAHCRLICNEKGASMIEYALVVAAVAAAGLLILGDTTNATSLMGKVFAKVTAIHL